MSKFKVKDWVYFKKHIQDRCTQVDRINELPIYQIIEMERTGIRIMSIEGQERLYSYDYKWVSDDEIINVIDKEQVYNYIIDTLKSKLEYFERIRKV